MKGSIYFTFGFEPPLRLGTSQQNFGWRHLKSPILDYAVTPPIEFYAVDGVVYFDDHDSSVDITFWSLFHRLNPFPHLDPQMMTFQVDH